MKNYEIEINGETYHVSVKELEADADMNPTDANPSPQTKTTPLTEADSADNSSGIHAPMAGTILKINVEPGQTVSTGDTVLVLEAMKMENEIVAPADGVVQEILVQINDRVQSDQLLLRI